MGKDQEENGIVCRNVTRIDTKGGISSIPVDFLLDNESSSVPIHEGHKHVVSSQHESPCPHTKNKIDETEKLPNCPILIHCAKNIQMDSSTSDIAVCDNRQHPCVSLDNNANGVLVDDSITGVIHQNDSANWDKVNVNPAMVDGPSNINFVEKENNNIFEMEPISDNSFYHGMKIPDISASNCLDKGSVTRDLEIFSRNSHSRRSLSPGRSPSPYSCGSTSSLREPGNISSQHFQVTWKSVSDTNLKNSMTKCERECVSVNNLSTRHKTHDDFFFNGDHKSRDTDLGEIRNFDEGNDSNNVDVYVISCDQKREGKPCHPEIPVIEDADVKRPPFSPNILDSISRYDGCDDNRKAGVSDEQKTTQPCKNDSLVRVSHFVLVDNVYKRLVDVRTVTDLMTSYSSLKKPIVLPFVRQRSFYDQWARLPSGDVINRGFYPRSSANMTIKCWTLLQAIQNDQMNQMKSNSSSSAPATGSNNRLVVPNPADVTCKSLESIIEHYNQISYAQNPIFSACAKTPPATPLKSLGSKTSSIQSSSSRSSSGNSYDKQRTANQCSGQNKDSTSTIHAARKHSPIPLRKKSNQKQNACKNIPQNYEISRSKTIDVSEIRKIQDGDKKENKNNKQSTNIDNGSRTKPVDELVLVETSSIPTAEIFSSGDDLNSFPFPKENNNLKQECQYEIMQSNLNPVGRTSHCSEREQPLSTGLQNEDVDTPKRDVSPRLRAEKPRLFSPVKEFSRDPYDVNTSTVRLNLPHDNIPYNKTDHNENSGSLVSGEKRGSPHQNVASAYNGMVGLARRSKTRLILTQMNPKPKHQEMLATSPFHNSNLLKQSLHINELQCSKDIDGKYHQKREKASKTGRSRSSTTWKHSTQTPPELPTRGYSMVDRLEPAENPGGQLALSPELFKPRSDRQSAVSLANVHFLDLTDLKTMLRKTNTPIPRL